MQRLPVSFSKIKSIGFDSSLSGMEVEFIVGGIFLYKRVPMATYKNLLYSHNKDQYFDENIEGKFIKERVFN